MDEPRFAAFKRVALAGVSAFIAVNIWTGAPLLALWVGSHAVGQTVLSMKAVFVVVLVFGTLVFTMAILLTWLNNTYRELVARTRSKPRSPWLRGMGAESEDDVTQPQITVVERIVVASVYAAVIALALWFVLVAGSPLPQ
jgi:hypothetical protein